jgi:glycosyltransferase involved in cell wall biosynthesis
MKTLFIGHYKEGTGWSQATINSILAANTAGVDIVTRNVQLTPPSNKLLNPILMQLESKPLKDIEYCIQNVLPHHMVGTQKFKKNIGYFVGESSTIKYSSWLPYLKLMDEIWVPNKQLADNLTNDGINKVKVIPYAFNVYKYDKVEQRIHFGNNQHKFKFYYVGELNDRKNIESVVRCFHSEFQSYEPVTLILKIKKFGINNNELKNHVVNVCNSIKSELRMYNTLDQYHQEIIITDEMNDDQIDALHASCDCFINPSHGEGWSIPSFDAMCFGKTPICSNDGGPKEFIDINDKSTGCLISGVKSICSHSDPAFPDIFTGREEWFVPSESEIKLAMRYYYENSKLLSRTSGIKQAQKFSYSNVGKMIKDALND